MSNEYNWTDDPLEAGDYIRSTHLSEIYKNANIELTRKELDIVSLIEVPMKDRFLVEPYISFIMDSSYDIQIEFDTYLNVEFVELRWGIDTGGRPSYPNIYVFTDNDCIKDKTSRHYVYKFIGLPANSKYVFRVQVLYSTLGSSVLFYSSFHAKFDNTPNITPFYIFSDGRFTTSLPRRSPIEQLAETLFDYINTDFDNRVGPVFTGDVSSYGDELTMQLEWFNQNLYRYRYFWAMQRCDHEGDTNVYRKYYEYGNKNEDYYSFDYGSICFIVFSQYFTNYPPVQEGDTQWNWALNILQNTTQQFKVAVFHNPGYSAYGFAGVGHPDEEFSGIQHMIKELLIPNGVQLCLCGHNHYYARCRIYHNSTHCDIVTSGAGGMDISAMTYPNINYKPDSPIHHIKNAARKNQFVVCEADKTTNKITCKCIDIDGNVWEEWVVEDDDYGYTNSQIRWVDSNNVDIANEKLSDGAVSLDSSIYIGHRSYMCGLRFQEIDIPQGSVIDTTDTYLVLYSSSLNRKSVQVRLQGELAVNPGPFVLATNYNITSRTKTTAYVDVTLSETWKHYYIYRIYCGSIIQEIINQGSWVSGNSLILFCTTLDGASDYKTAYTQPGDRRGPYIHIRYDK